VSASEESPLNGGAFDVIIARSDGDILRGGEGLSGRQLEEMGAAVGLTTLLFSAEGIEPVWLDLDVGERRLVTVAFNQAFVFGAFLGREQARAHFIEQARAIFAE